MFNKIMLSISIPALLSFKAPEKIYYPPLPPSDIHVIELISIRNDYVYRMKNNIPVPDYYYSILGFAKPQPFPTVQVNEPVINKIKSSPVPEWVLKGILHTETRSYYKDNGSIKYVDKRRGKDGEIGPFQIRKVAFDMVKKRGECFWDMETNAKFSEEIAIRYLMYLYNGRADGDWKKAIMMYNMGPYGRNTTRGLYYYNSVKSADNYK